MARLNMETMHSARENKAIYSSPESNDDCKESGESSKSRCLHVKFNFNIVEEKEENASKSSCKLLSPANGSLLSKYDRTEVNSDFKITNSAQKRTSVSKKEELFCFKRTLKMLGFEPKDFGIKEDNRLQVRNRLSPRSAPVLNTRLRERTVSLENLKTALQDIAIGAPSGEMSREMLARAAYEQWYFQKLHKEKNMKKMETEKHKQEEQNREKLSLEQKKRAEENFKKWVAQKNTELRKKVEQKPADSSGDKPLASEHKDAFIYWKKQKDKILRQKKLSEQRENEGKCKPRENDKETEKRFQMWKKKSDEALKAKLLQQKRKETEREEKRKREEEERKQNAAAAFLAWKKAKDVQLRREATEQRLLAERKQREKMEKEMERCYESEQAFEEWLDEIEERQKKQTQPRQIVKEPWSPGGSTKWLHSV